MRIWVLSLMGCGRIGFGELATPPLENDGSVDAAPDPDLIVHVTFDDVTGGDRENLVGVPTCSAARCPTLVSGQIGNALRFDGIDDYLQFASVPALDFGTTQQAFSISMWYRADDLTPPTQRVLMAQATNDGQVSYQLSFEDTGGAAALDLVWKVCEADCQGETIAVAQDLAALDRWTFVTATWDGTQAQLFVDAQLVQSVAKAGINYDAAPFMIGSDFEGGGSIEDSFAGDLDDLRIYKRVLSTTEQATLLAR